MHDNLEDPTVSAYAADREVQVTRFGGSSCDRQSTRVQRIDEFERELRGAIAEVMAATVTGHAPGEVLTQLKNVRNGHGLKSLACIYEAATNPRNGIAFAKAQRLVAAQMGFLERYHPQAQYADRWCPVIEERSVEWESVANDAQDTAERELARNRTSVSAAIAVVETTREQIVASRNREAVAAARLEIQRRGTR